MKNLHTRTFKSTVALTAVVAMASNTLTPPAQANILGRIRDSISSLWTQKQDKQGSARAARARASALAHKAEALHDRLEATQRLLADATDNYNNYWRQMRRTEAQLVATRHRVHIVSERYNRRRVLFGRRLAAMQRAGKLGYLELLLGSRTLSDLTRRIYLFDAVTNSDSELQGALRQDREELKQAQTLLMAQWHERNELQKDANRERERIARAESEGQRVLKQINQSRYAAWAAAAAEERSSRELEGMIGNLTARRDEIIESYEREARAREAREREASSYSEPRYYERPRYRTRRVRRYRRMRVARRVRRVRYQRDVGGFLKPMPISEIVYSDEMVPVDEGGGSLSEGVHTEDDGHNHSDDGWSAPVKGRVSSRYGMRYHPILRRRKLHTGDDLAARQGTPFRAAHSGRVLWAGWKKAYGKTIIVDDGKGTTTLYGHASKIGVKAGQPVKRGEYIGNVGSTGWSTGPHLHFEVRKGGKPINPSSYLRRRGKR